MADSFDERAKALEDSYFEKVNADALKRLKERQGSVRKSPITGKEMQQETYLGTNIDRCVDSGGVWLDAGELEQIVKTVSAATGGQGVVANLLKGLLGKK